MKLIRPYIVRDTSIVNTTNKMQMSRKNMYMLKSNEGATQNRGARREKEYISIHIHILYIYIILNLQGSKLSRIQPNKWPW